MDDKEAFETVKELVSSILLECQKYALKDGIDPLFVIKTVGVALADLAEKKPNMEWIDELYLEVKSKWNKIRALPDANPDERAFLVHLMEKIEKNTDN